MTHLKVPPIDPRREQALLAAFDAHWAQPRPSAIRWSWGTAAALVVIVTGLNWMVVSNPPGADLPPTDSAFDSKGFVPWPGADALPPFESGSLVRVDLPVRALAALGLQAPFSASNVVQADIVVGQDGFARAIRVVQ